MVFLSLEQIYKTYEGQLLLNGISLTVQAGEIVTLLGPSGSGKTTLLRIIAGLEPYESGCIRLEGQDIGDIPAHRRGIVLMFQDYALFPHRTVAENVAFGLRMQRQPRHKIQARVQEMLKLVGLEAFGDRSVVDLSGGEQQRVALARSLAPAPRLLLLDEPMGSLDRNLRERLVEELRSILRRVGVTAITVTHDQSEAFALADRVALLHGGHIVQQGSPQEVYQHPATPWVARFLGLTNLFPAQVTADGHLNTSLGRFQFVTAETVPPAGTTGQLLIPPWGIQVLTSGAGDKSLPAQVARCLFQGEIEKVVLDLGGAQLRITLQIGREAPLQEGQQVWVQIDPAALRWFPTSEEDTH